MTVQELIHDKRGVVDQVWLCPNIVNNIRFNVSPLLQGIECTKSGVPDELKSRDVVKYWREGKRLCIIWFNEPCLNVV